MLILYNLQVSFIVLMEEDISFPWFWLVDNCEQPQATANLIFLLHWTASELKLIQAVYEDGGWAGVPRQQGAGGGADQAGHGGGGGRQDHGCPWWHCGDCRGFPRGTVPQLWYLYCDEYTTFDMSMPLAWSCYDKNLLWQALSPPDTGTLHCQDHHWHMTVS